MAGWEIIVYIPVYNSEMQLPDLLARFKKTERILKEMGAEFKSIIFVNDKSTDNTSNIIKESIRSMPYLCVVDKVKNEGPAAAIFDGMDAASKEITEPEKTILIRMDSDLEHNPEDIPLMIKPIIENSAKIVAGYVPFDSRSGNAIKEFNEKTGVEQSSKFLGINIPQFCPGFIAMKGDLFLKIHPLIAEKAKEFRKKYGEDMVSIDFISLVTAKRLGEKIIAVKLSPIEDKYIKKQPEEKIEHYRDCHKKTMEFLES